MSPHHEPPAVAQVIPDPCAPSVQGSGNIVTGNVCVEGVPATRAVADPCAKYGACGIKWPPYSAKIILDAPPCGTTEAKEWGVCVQWQIRPGMTADRLWSGPGQ